MKTPAPTASGQAPKNVSQSKQEKAPPKTLPREELPPLSVPLMKNTFTTMYRLGWMYTLREFIDRIMKTEDISRTSAFEINVQTPFRAKYPHLPLCVSLPLALCMILEPLTLPGLHSLSMASAALS